MNKTKKNIGVIILILILCSVAFNQGSPRPAKEEEQAYNRAKNGMADDCAKYLLTYPKGNFREDVSNRLYKHAKKGSDLERDLFMLVLSDDSRSGEILKLLTKDAQIKSLDKLPEN